MARVRKRKKVREPIPYYRRVQENYEHEREHGKYYYADFPPGNKADFPEIERLCRERGVKYKFATCPSGGRCYRVKRKNTKGLMPQGTDQWNLIPWGLPHPHESGSWTLTFVFGLEDIFGPWKAPQQPAIKPATGRQRTRKRARG